MSSRALITRLVLENYKSIAFCDVKLGPLSLLVGPNGAGKSNFLDALRFLSEAMNVTAERAFQSREGFSNVLRRGAQPGGHLGIRVEFRNTDGRSGLYTARFVRGESSDFVVEGEKCSNGARFDREPGGSDRLDLPSMLERPEFLRFRSVLLLLGDCRFYDFVLEKIRQPSPVTNERILRADGANLATVLHHIARERRPVNERITQYLRIVYPALESIGTVEAGGYVTLQFNERAATFHPLQVSDGTLRSLAVLVALFQRAAGSEGVSLVGLEEPETALHPAAAAVLFDAMREASASVQVVATTHSADSLDKKDIDTDAILSVEIDDAGTRIGHVNETGRKALREQLYTAGELMRMNYLRPESSVAPDDAAIESLLFDDPVHAS